jgi:hypothetical protein
MLPTSVVLNIRKYHLGFLTGATAGANCLRRRTRCTTVDAWRDFGRHKSMYLCVRLYVRDGLFSSSGLEAGTETLFIYSVLSRKGGWI